MTPDDYGLSPELVKLLRRCRALWDSYEFGTWNPPEARGQDAEAAAEAIEALKEDMYPDEVRVH